MCEDSLKTLIKNVDSQLFDIVSHLICSICQELLNKPVTTPCGHCFCNGCIKRVLCSKNNSGCPLCKNPVKRYSLKDDKVKSTFAEICRDLPDAFRNDVKDLGSGLIDTTEDLIITSKLTQLNNQECVKKLKTSKRKKSPAKLNLKTGGAEETDSESFIPVLKRSKHVVAYASAKTKRLDDFVSISQTEVASNSSLCGSSEVDKKLEKMEKLPVEVKVNEWFDSVGDNIYLNSPNSSLLESLQEQRKPSSMIRRDYNKIASPLQTKENGDPYEFIPSQNNRTMKKKRQRKSKKIPDFQSIQNFTKESIKRASFVNEEPETEPEILQDVPNSQIAFTASQKFDKLLSETKENREEVKGHALYSASQSSSLKFLDVSFHSKIEEASKEKLLSSENEDKVELFKEHFISGGKMKRKRSLGSRSKSGEKKKKKLSSPIKCEDPPQPTKTKLIELLEELINDDVIYSQSDSKPISLARKMANECIKKQETEREIENFTQATDLIGFCTQEDLPEVRKFTEMVAHMEEELDSEQKLLEMTVTTDNEHRKNLVPFNLVGKIRRPKIPFIGFLQLGRLTPTIKRSRSSVVKLVFPIGLSSLARKRPHQSKVAVGVQTAPTTVVSAAVQTLKTSSHTTDIQTSTSRGMQTLPDLKPTVISTGVQTLQRVTPIDVQTSQEFRTLSAAVQTSKTVMSTEIQTSQVWRPTMVSTEVQTSQSVTSIHVQTSQVPTSTVTIQTSKQETHSVEIQTTQAICTSVGIQTSRSNDSKETQTIQIEKGNSIVVVDNVTPKEESSKKTSLKHRKIIGRMNDKEEPDIDLYSPVKTQQEDLILDFDIEKEFEMSCQRNHENTVVMKNRKNQQESLSLASEDSDVQPLRRSKKPKMLSSQESASSIETQEKVPEKPSPSEQFDIIDLGTPKLSAENSEDQMLRVLNNIDLDLKKGKKAKPPEWNDKSEESDSDFFVEQTPPSVRASVTRKRNSKIEAFNPPDPDVEKTPLRSRIPTTVKDNKETAASDLPDSDGEQTRPKTEIPKTPKDNSKTVPPPQHSKDKSQKTSLGLSEYSIPKALLETDSFLMLSAPENVLLTPPNYKNSFEQSKPNENDQNQVNSNREGETKPAVVEAWKLSQRKSQQKKKLCVVASSVKNPEMIKKFVSKFRIEYSNKPTKDMTHLIVGLHENDDSELLPLCTPKFLFAVANKKWIVSELWVETCLKMNVLLPEESFEPPDPVGGSGCRNARLSTDSLLGNCVVYLLGDFQTISKEEIADLIVDCGGTLVPKPEKFSFSPSKIRMIVADKDCLDMDEKQLLGLYDKYSTVILSRDVVIMSIQSYKIPNFTPYLLHPATEEDLLKKGYPSSLARNEAEDEGDDTRWTASK